MFRVLFVLLFFVLVCIGNVSAHSGGTDSSGGHHNWADGSGSYHYH